MPAFGRKTERDYGIEFAQSINADEEVDIDKILTSSISIPTDDYICMIRDGIENPSARNYWEGFNSAV